MNYEITQVRTIEELGRNCGGTICFKARGYWSQDSISIYVRRGGGWSVDPRWSVSILHSSGGRDPKEVASDAEAVRYFAETLIAAVDLAESIMAMTEQMEAFYQEQRAADKIERDLADAAKQALIDADEAIGTARAKAIVDQFGAESVLNPYREVTREFKIRGGDGNKVFSAVSRDKTKFYYGNGNGVISRKDLIEAIANSSAATI
jgi:hypothetical protein